MAKGTTDGRLDLSGYKTAAGAAKALHRYLQETYDTDEVVLHRPDENPRGYDAWGVVWEGGPYEWAVHLLGGESLARGEFPQCTEPEVTGFSNQQDWYAECHFSFDVQFFR